MFLLYENVLCYRKSFDYVLIMHDCSDSLICFQSQPWNSEKITFYTSSDQNEQSLSVETVSSLSEAKDSIRSKMHKSDEAGSWWVSQPCNLRDLKLSSQSSLALRFTAKSGMDITGTTELSPWKWVPTNQTGIWWIMAHIPSNEEYLTD